MESSQGDLSRHGDKEAQACSGKVKGNFLLERGMMSMIKVSRKT